jgi:hypothetical protein
LRTFFRACASFAAVSSLVLSQLSAAGQSSSFFLRNHNAGADIEIGGAFPLGPDFKEVFGAGLNFSVGPKITMDKNNRLWVKPTGGVKWYFKEIEEQNSVTEHFRTWKAGVEVQYSIPAGKTFTLFPLLRLDHNWCANYFSATYRTGFGPYDTEVERSEKFLTGKGFSADLGLKVAWDRWFAKLHYEHFQPTLNVNPVVMQESVNEGFVIDSQKDFKLSSLNLSVGTSLTF